MPGLVEGTEDPRPGFVPARGVVPAPPFVPTRGVVPTPPFVPTRGVVPAPPLVPAGGDVVAPPFVPVRGVVPVPPFVPVRGVVPALGGFARGRSRFPTTGAPVNGSRVGLGGGVTPCPVVTRGTVVDGLVPVRGLIDPAPVPVPEPGRVLPEGFVPGCGVVPPGLAPGRAPPVLGLAPGRAPPVFGRAPGRAPPVFGLAPGCPEFVPAGLVLGAALGSLTVPSGLFVV